MKLKNYTDIESDKIRQIISFVKPSGISNFDVRISNSGMTAACGRAYYLGSSYHCKVNSFIVVRVAKANKFKPYFSVEENGYLRYAIGSRIEAIVAVVAHELRHLWQHKHIKGRVWGSRGKISERDADAYALQKLRQWRRK